MLANIFPNCVFSGPDCSCGTADIGVLVETRPDNFLNYGKLQNFFWKMFHYTSRLRYQLKFLNIRRPRSYQEYTKQMFTNQLTELSKVFHKSMYPYQDVVSRIEKAVNHEMNEDFDSFSRYKVLLVFTERALNTDKLKGIKRVYREDITIINIAERMNYKALPFPSGAYIGRDVNFAQFDLTQPEKVLMFVQASDGNVPCI